MSERLGPVATKNLTQELRDTIEATLAIAEDADNTVASRGDAIHALATFLYRDKGQSFRLDDDLFARTMTAYESIIVSYHSDDNSAGAAAGLRNAAEGIRAIAEMNRDRLCTEENFARLAHAIGKFDDEVAQQKLIRAIFALAVGAKDAGKTGLLPQDTLDALEALNLTDAAYVADYIRKQGLAAPAPDAPSGKNPDGPAARGYSHG